MQVTDSGKISCKTAYNIYTYNNNKFPAQIRSGLLMVRSRSEWHNIRDRCNFLAVYALCVCVC